MDFDFRVSGALYSRVTYDSDTLDRVVGMIAGLNPALSNYQPTLAVVITWFEPRLHITASTPTGPPIQGTFQVILPTNGHTTFAVFIYENLGLIDEIGNYQVGFNSGRRDKSLNIAGASFARYTGNLRQISAYRIDGT